MSARTHTLCHAVMHTACAPVPKPKHRDFVVRPAARRSLLADMDYSIDLANEDPRTHTSMRTQRLARWPRTSTRLSGSRNVRQEAGLVCCADPAGLPRAIDHEPDPRTRAIGHILVITSSSSLLSTAATLRVHPIRTKRGRYIRRTYDDVEEDGTHRPRSISIAATYVLLCSNDVVCGS
jgi:hypothetical protein